MYRYARSTSKKLFNYKASSQSASAFQADGSEKSNINGGTCSDNADTHVLVDAEDEKHSAPFHSLSKSEEDKLRNGILNNSGETKTRRRATDPRPLPKELKKVTQWHGSGDSALEDEPFYHGYMTRTEAERVITKNGEFLVRKADVKGRTSYLVTVQHDDIKLHLRIQEAQKVFWLQTYCFESIQTLIRYHMEFKEPVCSKNAILESYVPREEWQLYHEQISTGTSLGYGAFGEVFKGTLTVGPFTKPIEVAVKTLRDGTLNSDDRVTFLREANVMLKLQHKNVVRLYGVATQKEPIMIVMEFAPGGSLLNKVQHELISLTRKRSYCYEIISGMQYLESEQVMHRDLAARNCLIGANDVCKISDFGLSLMGHSHEEKQRLRLPIRWLAPETLLNCMFSSKSDVWSYGVLMFEVFSNGRLPYENILDLRDLRKQIVFEGLRLKPPAGMPLAESTIMMSCFEGNPTARPSFYELKHIYEESCQAGAFQKMLGWFNIGKGNLAPVKG
uniref:Tyrosine-protein kinase n=1 Tax=Haemonchus contortus TaxID=6289 RepID=A0A7I4YX48_HAECO